MPRQKTKVDPIPGTPVVITWEDCCATGQDHANVSTALASYVPCIRRVAGFWIGRTVHKATGRVAILISNDDDSANVNMDHFGAVTQIPEAMVLEIHPFVQRT